MNILGRRQSPEPDYLAAPEAEKAQFIGVLPQRRRYATRPACRMAIMSTDEQKRLRGSQASGISGPDCGQSSPPNDASLTR